MIPLLPALIVLIYTSVVVVTPFVAPQMVNYVLSSPLLLGYAPVPTLDASQVTDAAVTWFADISTRLHLTWKMALVGWRGEVPEWEITPTIAVPLTSNPWTDVEQLLLHNITYLTIAVILLSVALIGVLVVQCHNSRIRNRMYSEATSTIEPYSAAIFAHMREVPITSPVSLDNSDDTLAMDVAVVTPVEATSTNIPIASDPTFSPSASILSSNSDASDSINMSPSYSAPSTANSITETNIITESVPIYTPEEANTGLSFGGRDSPIEKISPSTVDATVEPATISVSIDNLQESTKAVPSPQRHNGLRFPPPKSTAAVNAMFAFRSSTNVDDVWREKSYKSLLLDSLCSKPEVRANRHDEQRVSREMQRRGERKPVGHDNAKSGALALFNTADNPVDLTDNARDAA